MKTTTSFKNPGVCEELREYDDEHCVLVITNLDSDEVICRREMNRADAASWLREHGHEQWREEETVVL